MRKILMVFNAGSVNTSAIEFGCYIASLSKSQLTGVFLENIFAEVTDDLSGSSQYGKVNLAAFNEITETDIAFFRTACEEHGIKANIAHKRGLPIDEMISESRFADMIITTPDISFSDRLENCPSGFVKDLLEHAECPVIIAPESFSEIDETVFAYDGSRSAMMAIRQFAYLLPELLGRKITVLEVNNDKSNVFPEKPKIIKWMNTHFESVYCQVLHGNAGEEVFKYLIGKRNIVVIMGAFSRNAVSTFFKPSRANLIIKLGDFPVFITHH